jgi:hypothetical protein
MAGENHEPGADGIPQRPQESGVSNGGISHVPEWMTSPEAAVFSPRDLVVIPVRNLRDLRNTLDALSSFSSDSDDGGGRGNTTVQRVERAKLLPLLRSLLLEVVFGANTGSPTKESDHE